MQDEWIALGLLNLTYTHCVLTDMQQQCFDLQIPWYDVQSWLAGQQRLVGITNLQTVAQETQKYASQVERERERERERELDPSLDLILLMRYGLFVNWLVVAGKLYAGWLIDLHSSPFHRRHHHHHHTILYES